MSVCGNPTCTPKSQKYKINSFLARCNSSENSQSEVLVDAADIAVVLQTIGFKLTKFEHDEKDENKELVVTVSCGKSGLKAVLKRQEYECDCQQNAQFINKQEECKMETDDNGSNNNEEEALSTRFPPNALHLAREALAYLFSKNLQLQNPELPDRSTEPTENVALNWDVDPKTSPPTVTSSPIPENPDTPDKENILVNLLNDAKASIEKALSHLPKKNNTFTKRNVKRVSNIAMVPSNPTTPRSNTSTCSNRSTIKRPNTPNKFTSPIPPPKSSPRSSKPTPKLEKRLLLPCRIGSLRGTAQKSPAGKVLTRVDTPRPDAFTPKNLHLTLNTNKSSTSKKTLLTRNKSPMKMGKSGIPSLSKIPNITYKKFTNHK